MLLSEALTNFVRHISQTHNDPTLCARWHWGMETQANVSAKGGEPVPDQRHTYTNGVYEWWNIRIPKKAMSDPEFVNYDLKWPLGQHVEALGMTGWDGLDRVSRFVGFDFDAITGHAKGVGLTRDKLAEVREAACSLPWVETRKSTGGSGLHLYVLTDGIPTENHTIHAALARAILGMMSAEAGFDFAAQIDCCGSNMWFWHRTKTTADNGGLSLVEPAQYPLTECDLPLNWRDHVDVVSRRRAKVRVSGIADTEIDPFDQLTRSRTTVPLDPQHKHLQQWLAENGWSTIWIPDHHLMQTHTRGLAAYAEANPIKGVFETISEGCDPGTPNCFAFPGPNGSWEVCRFHQGVPEANTWHQSADGWTMCKFNVLPDLQTAATTCGGKWDGEHKQWVFDHARDAVATARLMEIDIPLPEPMQFRKGVLKRDKDGKIGFSLDRMESDQGMEAYIDKKKRWYFSTGVGVEEPRTEMPLIDVEERVRCVLTPERVEAYWMYNPPNDSWYTTTRDGAKNALQIHMADKDAKLVISDAQNKPWQITHLPFQDAMPGDRKLNIHSPQFVYAPSEEPSDHEHWDRIIRQFFRDVGPVLSENEWAQNNNIKTAYDYGLAWIACILREPFEPSAYLFAYGPQESGKSFLIKALRLLVTRGVAKADQALKRDFNGELEGAVIAYIEETNLSSEGTAVYNRIKELVTEDTLWIRRMRTDMYAVPNTLHFIQCSNERSACPVFDDDTRITVLYVPELDESEKIERNELERRLRDEAPAFMRTVMDLTLPSPGKRLRVPAIETYSKQRAMKDNRNQLEVFLQDHCKLIQGASVTFKEFYERFTEWLQPDERHRWSRIRVTRSLPEQFPVGTIYGDSRIIGNVTFDDVEPAPHPLVLRYGKLVPKEGP